MKRGLYIHIPFCKRKCNYCDFASFAGQEPLMDAYLGALAHEAILYKETGCNTLYIGGGTPSLLNDGQLHRLEKIIRKNFRPVSGFEESTFEANPESITPAKLNTLLTLGFNRLSMGLQSLNENELKTLGRIHTAAQFLQAYQAARQSGFKNINVDLMAGLPGQTLQSFTDSLHRVLELGPEHFSVYGLQVEEGTSFFERGVVCDQVLMREMLEQAHDTLTAAGYHHYEISNYALPGKESKHNLNYWQYGEYIGLGSSAATYRLGKRKQNTKNLQEYIFCMENGKTPTVFSERLTGPAKEGEKLMLAFRMLDGVELTAQQTELFGAEIQKHIQKGLLTQEDKKVKLTTEGIYMANEVFRSFVAPFENV